MSREEELEKLVTAQEYAISGLRALLFVVADVANMNVEVASAPWEQAHRLVRIGLKGREVSFFEKQTSNLVFLLDESGSRVTLRESSFSTEFADLKKQIRVIADRMDDAIANKDFERAAMYRDEEISQRENLQFIRKRWELKNFERPEVVRKDIDEVVSKWTGIPRASIKDEESE